MSKRKGLTEREGRFIDLYLKCLIAARAAREAGYSIKTARSIAHELMRKPKIKAAIDEGLKAQGLIGPQWEH